MLLISLSEGCVVGDLHYTLNSAGWQSDVSALIGCTACGMQDKLVQLECTNVCTYILQMYV